MATPYEKGRNFEYKVRNHLQGMGYLVARSPASKSPFDLIAICEAVGCEGGPKPLYSSPVVLLIQCKLDGRFSKKEQAELLKVADSVSASAYLAQPGAKRRGIELIQLDSPIKTAARAAA